MWYVQAEQKAVEEQTHMDDAVPPLATSPSSAAACSLASDKARTQNTVSQSTTPKWRPRYLVRQMEALATEANGSSPVKAPSVKPWRPSFLRTPLSRRSHETSVNGTRTTDKTEDEIACLPKENNTTHAMPCCHDPSTRSSERGRLPTATTEQLDANSLDDDATSDVDTRHTPAATPAPEPAPPLPFVLVPRAHGVNEALLCLLDASELVNASHQSPDMSTSTMPLTRPPARAQAGASLTGEDGQPLLCLSPFSPWAAHGPSVPSSVTSRSLTASTTTAQLVLSDSLALHSPKSIQRTRRVTRGKVRLLVRAMTKLLGAAVHQPVALKLHPDSAGGTYMVQLPSSMTTTAATSVTMPHADKDCRARAGKVTAPPSPALLAARRLSTTDRTSSSGQSSSPGVSPPRPRAAANVTMTTVAVFKPRAEEIGQALNPHGHRASDRDAVFRPGTGSRREMLAYCLDHEHLAGVPPTLEVVAQHVDLPEIHATSASPLTDLLSGSGSTGEGSPTTTNHAAAVNTSATTLSTARVGSLQSFVPDCVESADVLPGEFDVEEVQAIAIFDIRVLNGDRHGGNILVTPHRPSDFWYPRTRARRSPDDGHCRHRHGGRHATKPMTAAEAKEESEHAMTKASAAPPLSSHVANASRASSCSRSRSSASSACVSSSSSSPSSSSSTTSSPRPVSLTAMDDETTPRTATAPRRARRGRGPARRAADDREGQRHLVPIDHSYICPSGYADPDLEWLAWPQSKQPFTPRLLAYIARLDPETDAALVRAALLPPTAMYSMSTSHTALSASPTSALATRSSALWQPSPSTPAAVVPPSYHESSRRDSPGSSWSLFAMPTGRATTTSTSASGVHASGSPTGLQGHTGAVSLSSSSSSFSSMPLSHAAAGAEAPAGDRHHFALVAATIPTVRSAMNRKMKAKRATPALPSFEGHGIQLPSDLAIRHPAADGVTVHAPTEARATTAAALTWDGDADEDASVAWDEEAEEAGAELVGDARDGAEVATAHTHKVRIIADTSSDSDDDDDDDDTDDEEVEEEEEACASNRDSALALSLPDGVTGARAAFHRTFSTRHVATSRHVPIGSASASVTPRGSGGRHRSGHKHALHDDARPPSAHATHARGMRRARSAVTLSFSPGSPLTVWPDSTGLTHTATHEQDPHDRPTPPSSRADWPLFEQMSSPLLVVPPPAAPPLMTSSPMLLKSSSRREVSFAEMVTASSLTSPPPGLPSVMASETGAGATTMTTTTTTVESLCVSPTHVRGGGFIPEMTSLHSMDLTTDTEAADAAAEVVQCTTILLKVAALEFAMTAREIGELCRRPRIAAASFLEEAMEAARDGTTWRLDMNAFQAFVREQLANAEETAFT